ncbi:glutamate ABC transporter substrate-binding protein [Symbioplanes lichenis]|uniref:glutamate ABC transporter substrate-binding protein n=1 Tax=Symbioplanes lichenis TaxID=1629072 RepID=UPI0027386A61|nr:glutamate ABC transporter substrate-binding protein [Actinoplanes lichenis]
MRRSPALAVTLTALLALTGCGSAAVSLPEISLPQAPPAATQAPAPAAASCNPKASLRPPDELPEPGKMPAGSYMRTIQDKGQLVVGTGQDTLLFSSRNPLTGAVEGFDVDLARLVAQAIFGDPDKIDIRVLGYADRVTAPQQGRVDLVAGTMTATCARWTQADFSSVYYQAAKRVLVSTNSGAQSLAGLAGAKVCAAQGSTSLQTIAAYKMPSVTALPLEAVARPTFGECLVALQRNEVAAISGDDAVLAGLAAQDPYTKVIGPRLSEEPYAIALSKKHPEFTRFVNAVLAKARADGTWQRTWTRWLGDLGPAPQPPAAEYKD